MDKVIGIVIIALIGGIIVFHLVHHELYCKYKNVPGKAHCGNCSHRPVCQKYHKKKWDN